MPRTADPREQEAQLSRAVWSVLASRGIEHLTIRAVADAAGCTTGLVMHRFPSRRSLLRHARRMQYEEALARVEAAEAAAATPRDALRAVLRESLSLEEESVRGNTVWLGFLAAAVSDEELRRLHRGHHADWRRRVSRLVTAAAPQWPEARVRSAVSVLVSVAEGTAILAAGDPVTYPPAAQTGTLDTALVSLGLR
jgi:AcrR family transcriptional regulator